MLVVAEGFRIADSSELADLTSPLSKLKSDSPLYPLGASRGSQRSWIGSIVSKQRITSEYDGLDVDIPATGLDLCGMD